jgi:hypothetical protein
MLLMVYSESSVVACEDSAATGSDSGQSYLRSSKDPTRYLTASRVVARGVHVGILALPIVSY